MSRLFKKAPGLPPDFMSSGTAGFRICIGSYRFVNTDPAIAAIQLITISSGGSKAIEVTLPPLLVAIERLQSLDEAVHAESRGVLLFIYSWTDDPIAVEADGSHSDLLLNIAPPRRLQGRVVSNSLYCAVKDSYCRVMERKLNERCFVSTLFTWMVRCRRDS